MDIINKRRSVRNYTKEEIDDSNFELLVRAGFQAPTACNQKSLAFVIIKDNNIIMALSELSRGSKVLSKAQGAIAVILLDRDLKAPRMADADCAAATQNILLEATNLALGSCWIGIYPEEDRMSKGASILNLASDMKLYSIIALGYPENEEDFYYRDKFDSTKIYYNQVK